MSDSEFLWWVVWLFIRIAAGGVVLAAVIIALCVIGLKLTNNQKSDGEKH